MLNYEEIKEKILNDNKIVGVKINYSNDKYDFTLFRKKAIYNIAQKNYEDGLVRCIDSFIDKKKNSYEPLYDIEQLQYSYYL